MHGHLGLDLEARGDGREALDEAPREGPVARKDIREIVAEEASVERVEQSVAEGMAAPAGVLRDAAARAHHHVGALADQRHDQIRRGRRVVGAVAVGHDIDVRVDVREDAPDHIALAPARLLEHPRPGLDGRERRGVTRVVVEDIGVT